MTQGTAARPTASGVNGVVISKTIDDFPEDSIPYRWMMGETIGDVQPPLGDLQWEPRRMDALEGRRL